MSHKKIQDSLLRAFTLIELSVVLVIIGLIVGGVLTGRDLIRASEIRSISTQKEAFTSAIHTFKTKYDALPGDMSNAQTIWGAAADCSLAQTTAATCNGNGDGSVVYAAISGAIGTEPFLFWKHLENAGLLAGNFIGIADGAAVDSTTERNSPAGKLTNSLWFMWNWGSISGASWGFNGVYNHSFAFALYAPNNHPIGLTLTPAEMQALDSKMDNGKPGNGILRAWISSSCAVKTDGVTPAVAADADTAIYNINASSKLCRLLFPNVF